MEYCLICDCRLSGFEEDICNDCYYDLEQDGEDLEKEIKNLKEKNL